MKITKEFVESKIVDEHYWHVPGTTFTLCVLIPENNIPQVGESACADPAEFNAEAGRVAARNKALGKVWDAYGTILKNKIYEDSVNGEAEA